MSAVSIVYSIYFYSSIHSTTAVLLKKGGQVSNSTFSHFLTQLMLFCLTMGSVCLLQAISDGVLLLISQNELMLVVSTGIDVVMISITANHYPLK